MKNSVLMASLILAVFHQPLLAGQVDPSTIVESRLKEIGRDPEVTYRTNDNYVFCTAHCRDLNERNAVYDAFRNIPKYSLTATRNPPTVCVMILLDPAAYQASQQAQKLAAHIGSAETIINGKVVQKTKDGLLVASADGHLILVIDGPNLIDDDAISVMGYAIGTYEFSLPNGTPKTVRKYTCDKTAAIDYWAPLATAEATAEARKRADTLQPAATNPPPAGK